MRYRRSDVVEHAVRVLDDHGLADLSMRRIAGELGLRPSALYHHVASKQELLAAVADELLRRGARVVPDDLPWDAATVAAAHALRDAMLAYRDGAELVATVQAFGLGDVSPVEPVADALARGPLDADLVRVAATTVMHFVFGHVTEEQVHLQASSAGAIADYRHEGAGDAGAGRSGGAAGAVGAGRSGRPVRAGAASFDLGLSLVLEGVRAHARPRA